METTPCKSCGKPSPDPVCSIECAQAADCGLAITGPTRWDLISSIITAVWLWAACILGLVVILIG